jgi:5-formyltetrahydrofolate cyclo-ligase
MYMLPWVRIRREKKAIRALIEQKRRIYPADKIQEDSEAIMSQLERMHWFRDAQTVMIYYPIHNEVDLRPLLKRYEGQKTFLLPVTHRKYIEARKYDGEDMMRRGRYKVPEPQTSKWRGKIDLIIVPGVVFDNLGNRIGRGGGFYDRFLNKHRHVHQIGVAYDFQVKKHEIPHSRRDHPMDRIVTPTQTIGL